ncbi:hypothetical protein WOLCODRAFT_86245, partial [Wolfiporia cocos MD-104 SS10]
QVHTCEFPRCLVVKNGQMKCKRRAPFIRSDIDFVTESGEWGQKRLYEFMNGWVPSLLTNVRCNNDGKLVVNGDDSKNLSFYMVDYTAKKQSKISNLSAVMARGYAYHVDRTTYVKTLQDDQQLMMFRIVSSINREQELAAPMVMSYLMGWGDTRRSHRYVPIYWSSFVSTLLRIFPELRYRSRYVIMFGVQIVVDVLTCTYQCCSPNTRHQQ